MIRAVLVAWLSLTLLGMQQQLVVHELDHLRARLERGHDAVAQNPDGGPCVECSLLAAGTGAVPSGACASAVVAQTAAAVAIPFDLALAKASPASYLSRAPPTSV